MLADNMLIFVINQNRKFPWKLQALKRSANDESDSEPPAPCLETLVVVGLCRISAGGRRAAGASAATATT